MIERIWRRDALRVHLVSHIGVVVASAVVLVAGQPATAQESFDFEDPPYTGSAGGTVITGQDGFYIPVPDSQDGLVYTYADNALGLPGNPSGGGNLQFAGVTGGDPELPVPFARAQRDVVYGDGTGVWTVSFDIAATYIGVLPSAQNVGSFSTQIFPDEATFIALARWTDPATAANWNADYVWFDAAGAQLTETVPDPGFQDLAVAHWYRWSTTFNLDTNQILQVSITDLTTNVTSTNSPVGRYLVGGAGGGAPPPSGFRLFGGSTGAEGNTLAFDNISIDLAGGDPLGGCCLPDDSCTVLTEADCTAAGGTYSGDGTGCTPITCEDIPEACNKGAGPCDEPHDTPGCDNVECCVLVCRDFDDFCCLVEWDQQCVDAAIALGCLGCVPPKGDEGVGVPSSEDFDDYDDGLLLVDVNGWGGWDDNAGVVATVSSVQSHSAPHSVLIDNTPDDDAVQQYVGAYCEGRWTYTIWQYVPSEMVGSSFFILLNTSADGGDKNWSTQVNFTATTGIVHADFDGEELPLITDEWVEIRVEIDLDADTQDFFYGGDLLYSDSWSDRVSGGGERNIRALDLYANSSTAVYYDDVSLVPGGKKDTCPWDLDDNDSVGATDLLSLLVNWGPYEPCPPFKPADFDQNCSVGATDLLAMLVNWGPCP